MVAVDNARAGMAGSYILKDAVTTKNVGNLESYRAKRKADRTPEPFGATPARRATVRRAAARRAPDSLRFSPRVRRRSEVLGGSEGAVAEPGRQAAGGSRRGSPRRLRQLRRRHPARQLRRRRRHRLGPRPVDRAERHRRGFRQGQAAVRAARPQAARQMDARQDEARQERVAADQGARRYATTKGTEDYPHDSVLSGRTVEQVAGGDPRGADVAAKLRKLGAARRELHARELRPMLATPGKPFSIRSGCSSSSTTATACSPRSAPAKCKLYSRAGHDFTATFPEIAEIVAALPFAQFIVDAEVVVLDGARPAELFAAAKTRPLDAPRRRRARGARVAGQHLRVRSAGVRGLRLARAAARRAQGRAARAVAGRRCRCGTRSTSWSQGEALFDEAERLGLEGIIGKRAASPYVSKRSADWIKINAAKSDDFVVVGYLPPKQGGKGFGALLLAQYRGGVLTYAGRAGSGFAARDFAVLEPLLAAKPARGAAGRCRARARRRVARGRARRASEVQAAHAGRHAAPARVPAPARRQEAADCVWQTAGGDDARPTATRPSRRRQRPTSRPSGRPSPSRISTRCSGPPTATRRAT